MILRNDGGVAFGTGVQLFDVAGRMVREGVHLELSPEGLDRVRLGGVGRQENGAHGSIAPPDPRPGGTMHVQAVPDDDHRGAELAPEPAEKAEQAARDHVLVREEAKIKSRLASPARDGDRRDHRDALMGTPPLIDDGRTADRRPGAPDERGHDRLLSSIKTMLALSLQAFFLPGAIRPAPTPEWPPRPAPGPGARASGG